MASGEEFIAIRDILMADMCFCWTTEVRFPTVEGISFLFTTGSDVHPVSYPMGMGAFSPGDRVAGA
jgi:hypothetical protein